MCIIHLIHIDEDIKVLTIHYIHISRVQFALIYIVMGYFDILVLVFFVNWFVGIPTFNSYTPSKIWWALANLTGEYIWPFITIIPLYLPI